MQLCNCCATASTHKHISTVSNKSSCTSCLIHLLLANGDSAGRQPIILRVAPARRPIRQHKSCLIRQFTPAERGMGWESNNNKCFHPPPFAHHTPTDTHAHTTRHSINQWKRTQRNPKPSQNFSLHMLRCMRMTDVLNALRVVLLLSFALFLSFVSVDV